jgi:DNA-binding CsgD family transcriptional regulator
MDTVTLATLLAIWAASSEGVSIALEALAVIGIICDDGRLDALDLLSLANETGLHLGGLDTAGRQRPSDQQQADDLLHLGRVLAMLGGLELAQGNLRRARSAEDEARSIFHDEGDCRWEGLTLWYLGLISSAEHKQREAARAYRESLLAFIDAGDPPLVFKPLLGLATIAAETGQPAIAAHLLGSADTQRQRSGDRLLPFDLAAAMRAESLCRSAFGEAVFLAKRELGRNSDAVAWTQMASDIILATNERDFHVARARNGALTAREQEVLRLIAEGQSNPQIADALCVGVGTAKTHVAHILAKLGVSTRAAAASIAVRQRLI